MKKIILLIILLLVGCITIDQVQQEPADETSSLIDDIEPLEDSPEPDDVVDVTGELHRDVEGMPVPDPRPPKPPTDIPIKRVKVGEKVRFPNLQAKDPDGDELTYTFQKPLDKNGEWQTGPGDEGKYDVQITADDGTTKTRQMVRIIVETLNAPPEFQDLKDIRIKEGQKIEFDFKVYDPDEDEVSISYEGWRSSFPYTTTFKDAGVHTVRVIAKDGTHTVERVISIIVENANRPPSIHSFQDVLVMENEKVTVRADADDPDGDELTFTYSTPLDSGGQWITRKGDAGTYQINVTVSDGKVIDRTSFKLIVQPQNKPPIIKELPDISVREGDIVEIDVDARDPEEEDVMITISGWMTSTSKETSYTDQGSHIVTVTASDGVNEVNESFQVIVSNVNRAPVFMPGSFE